MQTDLTVRKTLRLVVTGPDPHPFEVGVGVLPQSYEHLRLGEEEYITDEVFTSCQRFVFSCYGQFSSMSLDKMRAQMFARKIFGKRLIHLKLCNLPSTSPAFKFHCQQAHFQTALWKGDGNDAQPNLDPKQFGWLVTGNVLKVVRLSLDKTSLHQL